VIGLAEMMNFPGVISGDPKELAKLGLRASHVDGHAPGVLGKDLQAYVAAGIRSDHESSTVEEGRERLRAGMWLLIRESSAARNLHDLLPLAEEFGPGRIAFCTDDRDPEHISAEGHVNSMVREAVTFGIPVEDALVMASFTAAQWHGLRDFGAVAPGYQADLLVLEELESFMPATVLKRGRPVEEIPRPEVPDWVKHTVRIQPVANNDFQIEWKGGGKARVIGLVEGQIVTEALEEEPKVEEGLAVADPARDLAKIAVVERHLGTGRIGLGFVRGFGLERGAMASTIAHDAHNIVVVGVDDGDMARAVQRLAEMGGGLVVIADRGVQAELPLPVAGLLSDAPLAEVVEASRACVQAAEDLGCKIAAPFQILSFLALSVIPKLKITDRGLVDVDRFEVVSLPAG
jgi:adenine deaminase